MVWRGGYFALGGVAVVWRRRCLISPCGLAVYRYRCVRTAAHIRCVYNDFGRSLTARARRTYTRGSYEARNSHH